MELTELLTENLIKINLEGSTRDEVMEEMVSMMEQEGVLNDREGFKQALFDREAEGSTGIGFGIAIPHGKTDAVKKPSVAFATKQTGVDWNSMDGQPAKLVFMIAVPESSAGNEHLKILATLSRKLMDEQFRTSLQNASSKEEVLSLIKNI